MQNTGDCDPVHRRAAHARRRGRRRGRGRRGEHPQAVAGARRAAVHRRDHAGRVPQVHRARRRARAPLPAGHGRGADDRGDHRDPQGRHASATRSTTSSTITDEALKAAAELSARYVTDRFLPDKAIDLIDEAAQPRAHPPLVGAARRCAKRMKDLERAPKEKDAAIDAQQYELAAEPPRPRGDSCGSSIEQAAQQSWQASSRARDSPSSTEEDIAEVVAMWTGIPVTPHRRGGVRAPAPDGGRAPRPGHRPGRGDRDRSPRPSAARAPA